MATGNITNATWNYMGGMAINNVANLLIPSPVIPITDNFGFSMSPAFRLGTGGLTGGFNMTGVYSNGDFSMSASIGAGGNYWGWKASATINGWGGGYGRTYYGQSEVMGQQYGKQTIGSITGYFNHHSFTFSNDALGDGKDRWRTNAVELNIDRFSIGTYLYTNWGLDESPRINGENVMTLWLHSSVKMEMVHGMMGVCTTRCWDVSYH